MEFGRTRRNGRHLRLVPLREPTSFMLTFGQRTALSECSAHDSHKDDPKRFKSQRPDQWTNHTHELKPDLF